MIDLALLNTTARSARGELGVRDRLDEASYGRPSARRLLSITQWHNTFRSGEGKRGLLSLGRPNLTVRVANRPAALLLDDRALSIKAWRNMLADPTTYTSATRSAVRHRASPCLIQVARRYISCGREAPALDVALRLTELLGIGDEPLG